MYSKNRHPMASSYVALDNVWVFMSLRSSRGTQVQGLQITFSQFWKPHRMLIVVFALQCTLRENKLSVYLTWKLFCPKDFKFSCGLCRGTILWKSDPVFVIVYTWKENNFTFFYFHLQGESITSSTDAEFQIDLKCDNLAKEMPTSASVFRHKWEMISDKVVRSD